MKKCEKCEKEFPNRVYIDGKYRNLQNRKSCLECLPFGERFNNYYKCTICNESDQSKFHLRSNGTPYPYCKKCHHEKSRISKRKNKLSYVKYKGGKCEICDYKKCINALDFHHLNPKEKDFEIGLTKNPKLNDKIKEELDKCILVCCRCHREIHDGLHKEISPEGFEPPTVFL